MESNQKTNVYKYRCCVCWQRNVGDQIVEKVVYTVGTGIGIGAGNG